jgi:hypothetical protein
MQKNLDILEHGFSAECVHLAERAYFQNHERSGIYRCFSNLGLSRFTVVPAFSNILDEWVRPTSKGD